MAKVQKYFGQQLWKFRKLTGLSQQDAKWILELKSSSIISRWEKGIEMPNGDNLLRLSALYSILANELYFEHYSAIKKKIEFRKKELLERKRLKKIVKKPP